MKYKFILDAHYADKTYPAGTVTEDTNEVTKETIDAYLSKITPFLRDHLINGNSVIIKIDGRLRFALIDEVEPL